MSFADLSFWCYECDSYIEHHSLRAVTALASEAKFKEPPVGSLTFEAVITERNKELNISDCTSADAMLFKTCTHCTARISGAGCHSVAASRCVQCILELSAEVLGGVVLLSGCNEVRLDTKAIVVPVIILEDCFTVDVLLPKEWGTEEKYRGALCVTKCCSNVRLCIGERALTLDNTRSSSLVWTMNDNALQAVDVESYEKKHGAIKRISAPPAAAAPATVHRDEAETAPAACTAPPPPAAADTNYTGHGHSTEEEIKEFFDTPEDFEIKMKSLAELVKKSKYIVVYTGAGISTSASIPDYRGPKGVWTMQDKGGRAEMNITLEEAVPTSAHMAIAELVRTGVVAYVVSTNIDGLHRRSGIPKDKISELHGNCYIETCNKCHTEYHRSYDVSSVKHVDMYAFDPHATGRKCDKCDGYLIDSIINFGESLPVLPTAVAVESSRKADLALVLGTSMMVHPACDMPGQAREMVICNLQRTMFDKQCSLRIFERTDKVMTRLMELLGVRVPPFTAATKQ
eukprot:TRINITY_DN4196_c0_g1_i1.p1 TRINITY_DN4196_c0_g1~~TRINITY_DN4196_c0_g1_i1.p1  ORF type:complete len:515 (-),score=143.31 TRINITY_DN4196_c0_g1_i1:78-1622(-)